MHLARCNKQVEDQELQVMGNDLYWGHYLQIQFKTKVPGRPVRTLTELDPVIIDI